MSGTESGVRLKGGWVVSAQRRAVNGLDVPIALLLS